MLILIISLLFLVGFISKLFSETCDSQACLVGKTALVTGGSSGIGYQIVLDLAKRGCKVIVADKKIDEDIKDAIIRATNNRSIALEYVDMASFTSVRTLVERVKRAEEKLDVLINNAGVLISSDNITEDGLNLTWQINYYSSFLLTHLLVDLLKKSQSGRIIFTSSSMSFFNNLGDRADPSADGSMYKSNSLFNYSNTKCLAIVISDLFAAKLEKYNITSNSFHPGVVYTQIFQSGSAHCRNLVDHLMLWTLYLLLFFFGKSAKEGAQTGIYLAVAREVEGISGKYFGSCSPTRKPKISESFCESIWRVSENVVKLNAEEKL